MTVEEKTAARATVVHDGGFGACSVCSALDPDYVISFAKVGNLEFGVCFKHRIFWEIGSNNLSPHRQVMLNEMEATARKMHGFRLVGSRRVGTGILRVDDCGIVWDAFDAVEGIKEYSRLLRVGC